jgi:hypothetical protein
VTTNTRDLEAIKGRKNLKNQVVALFMMYGDGVRMNIEFF